MFEDKARWAYETMACHVIEGYRVPGVQDAFAEGTYCWARYREAMDARDRLLSRLGVDDEDKDLESMIGAFEDIQRILCLQMYRYGAENE